MKKFLPILVLLLLCKIGFSYTSLRVSNPQNSWYSYTGTIENAAISVSKKGVYLEYNVFLRISGRGTPYTSNDTLEAVYTFDLPEGAMVTDSWLWIGDEISKSIILDRWTASSVYENIVNRRRDPSILTKESATHYSLKVFPIPGNESRDIKFTYLVPVSYGPQSANSIIPTHLLEPSNYSLSSFEFILKPSLDGSYPTVSGAGDLIFEDYQDSAFAGYKKTIVPGSYINTGLYISHNIELTKKPYLVTYPISETEGYYQLAYLPGTIVKTPPKKVVFMVDYDKVSNGQTLTKEELAGTLRKVLTSNFGSLDSFNLILSSLYPFQYSETWVCASLENIESAISTIQTNLATYSNISSTLVKGIDFVKAKNEGVLVLISNSTAYKEAEPSNELLKNIMEAMGENAIPVFTLDYNQAYEYSYIGGRYYYGNEYLYTNLCRLSGGSLYSLLKSNSTFESLMTKMVNEAIGLIGFFDLEVDMASGYTYGNRTANGDGLTFLNQAVVQSGRYNGTGEFTLTGQGMYRGNFETYSQQITPLNELDTTAITSWNGLGIAQLENSSSNPSNTIINSIIETSMNNRVLSRYTAFLCLEDSIYRCHTCVNESSLSIDEFGITDSALIAYPNPFSDQLTVSFIISSGEDLNDISVRIMDIQGREIVKFSEKDFEITNNTVQINWNASGTELQPGMYLIQLLTPKKSTITKVLRQ